MSDRMLIAGATVPMLLAVGALVLLQRVPGARAAQIDAAAAPRPERQVEVRTSDKTWTGVLVASSTAELAANGEGRVEAVFVQTGTRVRAGERLVQFDRGEASNSIGMANAQLEQRRSELARSRARAQAASQQLQRLRAGAAWLSKQELESAAAEARMAEAELEAARASVGLGRIAVSQQRLRADRQLLTAPFDGTVVALGVDAGDSVVAGQVVLRILSDQLQVNFAFPPSEMPSSAEPEVSIRLPGVEPAARARVGSIRPELDPSAELVFASAALPAELPSPERWLPGAAVSVTLSASEPKRVQP